MAAENGLSDTLTEKQCRLASLTARAAAKDAIKDYNAASELYSQATELQAELNGEMAVENADLLFAYGKSLYNVAVSKSDVLGTKVAGESAVAAQPSKDRNASAVKSTQSTQAGESLIANAISHGVVAEKSVQRGEKVQSAAASAPNKAFFQFEGDENFDDSDENDDAKADGKAAGDEDAAAAAAAAEEEAEEGGEEDEDDFANAYEVLDFARILYLKKLETAEEKAGKGKSTDIPPDIMHIKERLADTHDLQAEISLEAERFTDAVADLQTALQLREVLYPMEDPAVAECHYKLSLALEFASVKKPHSEEGESSGLEKTEVDPEMRQDAVRHMEKAIESCKLRLAVEQRKIDDATELDEDKVTATKRRIANVKEIIVDMEQRLVDLRLPPASIEDSEQNKEAMMQGILGQIVGQPITEQKARLDAANKEANDLSAFVRKKTGRHGGDGNSKRAAEDPASHRGEKRARTEQS